MAMTEHRHRFLGPLGMQNNLEIADGFAAAGGRQRPPDTKIDIVADELHRAVSHRLMHSASMLAAAGKRLVEHVRVGASQQIAT
jgi:hypothetical protein